MKASKTENRSANVGRFRLIMRAYANIRHLFYESSLARENALKLQLPEINKATLQQW
jgi:hypothetical protein